MYAKDRWYNGLYPKAPVLSAMWSSAPESSDLECLRGHIYENLGSQAVAESQLDLQEVGAGHRGMEVNRMKLTH